MLPARNRVYSRERAAGSGLHSVRLMDHIDFADEQRKLEQRYTKLSDERIAAMWAHMDDYTELAQQILRAEISKRGLAQKETVHSQDPV